MNKPIGCFAKEGFRTLVCLVAILGGWTAGSGASVVRAGEPDRTVPLWANEIPGFQVRGEEERDTSTAESRTVAGKPVIRLGGVADPEMHLYLPEESLRTETAVVICPGGGFSILAWDLEGTEVATWLQSIGVTAAVLKYRVPTRDADPSWMAPAMDAQRAVRQLRAIASQEGWSIRNMGLLGFSAGGQTAVRAATAGSKSYYAPQDATDREYSAEVDFAVLVYPAYLLDENNELHTDLTATESTPPMFFAHAQDDPISCEGSIEMFRSLLRAGVPSELHVYAGGGHGFGMRATEQPCSQWPKRCEQWMRSQDWLSK